RVYRSGRTSPPAKKRDRDSSAACDSSVGEALRTSEPGVLARSSQRLSAIFLAGESARTGKLREALPGIGRRRSVIRRVWRRVVGCRGPGIRSFAERQVVQRLKQSIA